MAKKPKVIITCAVTGAIHTPTMSEHLPVTHDTMTPEIIAKQKAEIEGAKGKVLAYCASGTRSTVMWALGQAGSGDASVDEIVSAAARGGYDLAGLRPRLEALAAQ